MEVVGWEIKGAGGEQRSFGRGCFAQSREDEEETGESGRGVGVRELLDEEGDFCGGVSGEANAA